MLNPDLTGILLVDGVEGVHARCLLCFGQPCEQLHTFGCLVPDPSIDISESNEERREYSLEVDYMLSGLVRRNECKGMAQRDLTKPRVPFC